MLHNCHHWENWTTHEWSEPYSAEIHCVHMIIDWMAMARVKGDTAQSYYEAHKDEIKLPDWAVDFCYEIFNRIEEAPCEKQSQ